MTTLVERLTAVALYCGHCGNPSGEDTCHEAAATITRLEIELAKHQLVGGTILSRKDLAALIDRAEAAADRERELVEALRPFAEAWNDCGDEADKDSWSAWESSLAMHVTYGHFRKAARALQPDQGETT